MVADKVKVNGELEIILIDEFGNIKIHKHVKNLVVTTGKNYIASRIANTSAQVMSHMEIGHDATTATVGNTSLVFAASGGRVPLKFTGGVVDGSSVTYSALFPAGAGVGTLTEAGIFNASLGGTMLSRTTFSAFQKGNLDVLTINWKITFS